MSRRGGLGRGLAALIPTAPPEPEAPLPATVTARPRFLFTAFPLVIPAAAWWTHRHRIGWELTLVACGAGLATLTGLYGVFGAIP